MIYSIIIISWVVMTYIAIKGLIQSTSLGCSFGLHKGEFKPYKNGLQMIAHDYMKCERCGHVENRNVRRLKSYAIYQLEQLKRDNPGKSYDCYGEEVSKEDDYIDMINRTNKQIKDKSFPFTLKDKK